MSSTREQSVAPLVVVIYGDFNCPFSAAASARAERVEAAGIAKVDWYAVEHAPEIPADGELVGRDLADQFDREIDQINEQLSGPETGLLHRPSRRINTNSATAAYAGSAPEDRAGRRRDLFAAYWQHDADIADGDILNSLGASGVDTELAAAWRRSWLSLTDPIVPVMVLSDGYVSRGLGASGPWRASATRSMATRTVFADDEQALATACARRADTQSQSSCARPGVASWRHLRRADRSPVAGLGAQ